ncbi:UDP-N-acetylmuramoyl-tripeptide--D-alanyl-D-alanine ligase [Marinigracilibium pacificum]|uniref:UDP-N-acetylmuramoyl-tripeptide--D-alanyl-D-alanine ligase n=1 Tax=Marinigracilibium pacificum TaxID=2729599 RepID=A0A848IVG7_9BACT|nr:UDP-N-acetylmuramoyl-tripeptide--D-alanyl-D-alanine ligase [Marinigracilibium pacificum]NMM47178.1 UDP-N-acetylmuramoyl-tripeptide--D-alanyl-D-alanine ligase [Marinigracilibium pacificum]
MVTTQKLYELFLNCPNGVGTDTRKDLSGQMFFALKGPNFNANKLALEAIKKGASFAVVDDEKYADNDKIFLVEDGLLALQDLARYHRKTWDFPVLGITGSNGKTTSKELIREALSAKFNVWATQGNLNNHIGVPLTILNCPKETDFAIIEMGANKIGDISELTSIALPDYGLITNIGKAHTEGFGGFEGVIRGKSELYQHLIETNGVVFINSTDEILSNMAKRFVNPIMYPAKGDYFECNFIEANPFVEYQPENMEIQTSKMLGSYNFINISAALCIARYFKVELSEACTKINNYEPKNNRSQIIKGKTNTVIMDAYNANPSSMAAALENLKAMPAKSKAAILGDMNELGETSQNEHLKIGEWLNNNGIQNVFFVGEKMSEAKATMQSAGSYKTVDDLIQYLQDNPISNSLILVKASRSIGLEKLEVTLKSN